ncbi:MAG: D-alanyl-D-alanine carboxypeptidase [Gammaproteobacteria bacterium]|nr:D-alanyl-D-alanine carboxypeptidase [Gammaproteobacteria bacterium]
MIKSRKKLLKMMLMPLIVCVLGLSFSAQASVPVPAPPQVAAKNYLLIDFDSGRILAEKDADAQIEPASITKLMTSYVVYSEIEAGRLKLDEKVLVSEKAWRMGGSRMYLEVGSKVSVELLLKGLIIQSGNDASVALAEHIAGGEDAFVGLMNQYAANLGMTATYYKNSTGWPDPEHLTSARDIATLAKAFIKDFPEHYKGYSEKVFTYNNIKQYNRNKLLWRDKSVDGLKTGHTESAGYCLVSSAKRSDMRLISVVLGTDSEASRASVSQSLLNYGFRFYETHKLYAAGETLNQSRVWEGDKEQVALGLANDLHVTIPRGAYEKMDALMNVDANITAPFKKGSQLGEVRIMLNEDELSSVPLVALQRVERGNFIQVTKDYILKLFE